jgi:hypothetical protein
MATLDTLSNLITNAKQTPSGKVEWTDTSLKGIQDEVKLLFSQNGAQVTENTGTLSVLNNESSQLAIVTEDATVANNGVYFWNLTPVSSIFFPAGSNGYWNILEFGVLTAIAAGYFPYSDGSNFIQSLLQQTTNEIKMVGGSFVANNSTSAGPYFQCGDTDSIGNDVIFTVDDKIQTVSTKKGAANKGIRLDLNGNIHLVGDLDTRKQLSIDGNNSVYALGDAIATKGLRIDTVAPTYKLGNYSTNVGLILADTTGYLGSSTVKFDYTATSLFAGFTSNSSGMTLTSPAIGRFGTNEMQLSYNNTTKIIFLGDASFPRGLTINAAANGIFLGDAPLDRGLTLFPSTGICILGGAANHRLLKIDIINQTFFMGNDTNNFGLKIDLLNQVYTLSEAAGAGLIMNASNDTYRLGSTNYGVDINETNGTYKLGGFNPGVAKAIGVHNANNPEPEFYVDDALIDGSPANTPSNQKVRVYIPGLGVKYLQLFDN